MGTLSLPRGRIPQDEAKLGDYIKKVASLNGCTYEKAHAFVMNRFQQIKNAGGNVPAAASETVATVPEKQQTDEELLDETAGRFDMLHTISRGACTGAVRSVIVSGPGGIGKTYDIEGILDHYRETQNIQSEMVKGVLSPVNLYKLLYRNRTKSCVTVLDDADGIFYMDDALSVLKAALDSGTSRKISWMSDSNSLKQDDVPTTFVYEGSMIFITNIDFQAYVDANRGKLAPHLQALLTRAMYLDLRLNTDRHLMLWIRHVISKKHVLVQNGLKAEQEKAVLDFMEKNRGRLRNLSIRTALKIASFVKMDPHKWQNMALQIECK